MKQRWAALAGFELIVILLVGIAIWLNRPVQEPKSPFVTLVFPSGFSGPFSVSAGGSEGALRGGLLATYFIPVDSQGRATMSGREFGLLQSPGSLHCMYANGTGIGQSGPSDGAAWAEWRIEATEIKGIVHPATVRRSVKLN